MKALLVEDNGNQLTIKINKSDFNGAFLDNIVKRIELEQLVTKASVDPLVLTYLKDELSNSFNDTQAQYYKGKNE